jgi:two-component sensor histidine kinase
MTAEISFGFHQSDLEQAESPSNQRYPLATVGELREALLRERVLIGEKDRLIRKLTVMSEEADHRLVNNVQTIASLLTMQSKASLNADAAAQLRAAANRVAIVGQIHRRLHSLDGVAAVAFRRFLADLTADFSNIMHRTKRRDRIEINLGAEIELPTGIAIPLGFIVSELLTNAVKHGGTSISITFDSTQNKNEYQLSVLNDGKLLPQDFDPASGGGLGMKIIGSYIDRIGGSFFFGPGPNAQGAHFGVVFTGKSA